MDQILTNILEWIEQQREAALLEAKEIIENPAAYGQEQHEKALALINQGRAYHKAKQHITKVKREAIKCG